MFIETQLRLYHLPQLSRGVRADGSERPKWATLFDAFATKTTLQLAIIHALKATLQDTSHL